MRYQLNKLKKGKSTKAERKFSEILKENHIPFRTKVKICGMEVDFLIGNYAIEIESHPQKTQKNKDILEAGYTIIHFYNWEIKDDKYLVDWIKKIWLTEQGYLLPQEQR